MIKYALDTNIVTYYLKGNQTIIDRSANEIDEVLQWGIMTYLSLHIVFTMILLLLLTMRSILSTYPI